MARAIDEDWIFFVLTTRNLIFELDPMAPAIAEIDLENLEFGHVVEIEVAKKDLCRFEDLPIRQRIFIEFRSPHDQAADDELMQMGIGPAEGGLNDFVQLREIEVSWQQQSPPDRRIDVRDRNLHLVDERVWAVGHGRDHGAQMRTTIPGDKFERQFSRRLCALRWRRGVGSSRC